jgi:predicted nucleic acid-binding protein
MARAEFLADTSAFARLSQTPVSAAFAPLVAQGRIALCSPVIFELGFSARNLADYRAVMSRLSAFETVPTTDGDHQRALSIRHLLAERGQHRMMSLVDALVAAVAESRDLTVLHYDGDFDVLAQLTGQPHRWIVPRGTAD